MGILGEGNPLSIRSSIHVDDKSEENTNQNKSFLKSLHDVTFFGIDLDGSIYSTRAPYLPLGFSPFPGLYLVARNSRNQAVFKHFLDLISSGSKVIKEQNEFIEEPCTRQCREDVVKLELSSHPGMGIVRQCFNDCRKDSSIDLFGSLLRQRHLLVLGRPRREYRYVPPIFRHFQGDHSNFPSRSEVMHSISLSTSIFANPDTDWRHGIADTRRSTRKTGDVAISVI